MDQNNLEKQYLENLSILYVEDDDQIRDFINSFFISLSLNFDIAINGEDGLDKYMDSDYDIVITDIKMPVMDGIEMIKQIKTINPLQKIIVTTGYGDNDNLIKIMNLGVSNFFSKPLNIKMIKEKVLILAKQTYKEREAEDYVENYRINLENIVKEKTHEIEKFKQIIYQSPMALSIADIGGTVNYVNPKFEKLTGYTKEDIINKNINDFYFKINNDPKLKILMNTTIKEKGLWQGELIGSKKDNSTYNEKTTVYTIRNEKNEIDGLITFHENISNVKKLETQLLHAQKMESIGQLAAGIAHEINTPIQYIGDNIRFLQDGTQSFFELFDTIKNICSKDKEISDKINQAFEDIDIEFMQEEVPTAISQSIQGIDHITNIVKAMKEFSHPGVKDKVIANLNDMILTVVNISRNEWKYVADLETKLDNSIPHVNCLVNEINQVILNMIINASHAIEDIVKNSGEKGKITISTGSNDKYSFFSIADTGSGIPDAIKERIFDPFFTTKGVGKGTGQGLYITHDIVVNKHKGLIDLESKVGEGTKFTIFLPIDDA